MGVRCVNTGGKQATLDAIRAPEAYFVHEFASNSDLHDELHRRTGSHSRCLIKRYKAKRTVKHTPTIHNLHAQGSRTGGQE